ncbi:hypothetical protein AX15_007363 [Amanita polypyramis BW_CC]|nr:hypothetical protein AX15_007363 [Amanita polypyramis BW_CC]
MSTPIPLVYRLTLDDWESIALHMAVTEGAIGPPVGLRSLLLLSRHIYARTCVKNNVRLYSRLFQLKFDCSALRRRCSEGWTTDRCFASELIKRFTAMKRIRNQVFHFDDLWTCYLMMLENDQKNVDHLLNWANLKRHLYALIIARAQAPPRPINEDSTLYALTTWLLWMTSSRETFTTESSEILKKISQVLHPLLAAGYLHPSSYAPDTCFDLPLRGPIDFGNRRCSGPEPPKAQIVHYSHALTVSYPFATTAATLLWVMQAEVQQNEQSFPRGAHMLPHNREEANAVGPTYEDIYDFHYRVRVQECYSRPASEQNLDPEIAAEGSRRFDEAWTRLVACHDPCLGDVPLRGPVYKIGTLSGRWSGRFILPHFEAHMNSVLLHRSPQAVRLVQKPLYWTLREHHCLGPDEPLSVGMHESGVDDVLNAWLPRGYTIEQAEDAIVVCDPNTEQSARYETFISGDPAHYSRQACEKLKKHWISAAAAAADGAEEIDNNSASGVIDPSSSYIDNDDEYADYVDHLSSGVTDILVSGETGSPGDAWGHFQVIGRVRPWDGFVVLLQIPGPTSAHLGRWIFKGYVHERNFVGRWRETSTSVGMVGLEGGFVMTRREE